MILKSGMVGSIRIAKQANPGRKWRDLGQRLKRARESSEMTQETTAEQLGVSSHAVSMWETGSTRPDQSRLPRIAALYGVSTDYLLSGDRQIAESQASYDVTSSRTAVLEEIQEIILSAQQQLTAAELRRIRDFLRFMIRQTRHERHRVGTTAETEG